MIYAVIWSLVVLTEKLAFFSKQLSGVCCALNNNLSRKLVSSIRLQIIFDDNHKTASVSFFIADFNLLSCEFNSFVFKLLPFYINKN